MQTPKLQAGSIAAVLLVLFSFSLASAEGGEVSMISLIAAPEKYDGKIVGTVGIVVIRDYPIGTALYLSREDAERRVEANAIGLLLNRSQTAKFRDLNGQRVYVRGRYHQGQENDGAIPNGEITEITTFDGDFWPRIKLPPLK